MIRRDMQLWVPSAVDSARASHALDTRSAVLRRVRRRRVRGQVSAVVVVLLALTLGAQGAWAATHGGYDWLERARTWIGVSGAPVRHTSRGPSRRTPTSRTLTAPIPRSTPSLVRETHTQGTHTAPSTAPVDALRIANRPRPVPASLATLDRLYRTAHHAHFVLHDDARALAAWDRYLAARPEGAFAPEARFNRAICLARLGQRSAALRALEPFAQGRVEHGYRQADAQALSSALRAEPLP